MLHVVTMAKRNVISALNSASITSEIIVGRNFKTQQYKEHFSKTLLAAFNAKEDADVSIVAETKVVRFHQCVLAASSPLFKKLLLHNVACPCQPVTIHTAGYSYKDIQRLNHLLYLGNVNLPEMEVSDFLATAKQLEIDVTLLYFNDPITPPTQWVSQESSKPTDSQANVRINDTQSKSSSIPNSNAKIVKKITYLPIEKAKPSLTGAFVEIFKCVPCNSHFPTRNDYQSHVESSHSKPQSTKSDPILETDSKSEGVTRVSVKMELEANDSNNTDSVPEKKKRKLERICSICKQKMFLKDWESHREEHFRRGENTDSLSQDEYECSNCQKIFTVTWGKYVKKSQFPKNRNCHLCGEEFSSVSNASRHIRRTHKSRPQSLCSNCDVFHPRKLQ